MTMRREAAITHLAMCARNKTRRFNANAPQVPLGGLFLHVPSHNACPHANIYVYMVVL
jgi:hypothetical protein